MQPELPQEMIPDQLENYFLLFKAQNGELLGFCVTSYLASEQIDGHIESAKQVWLETEEGKVYIEKEARNESGVDYADILMNIPPEILAQQGIFLGEPVQEIIELDVDENLLRNK